MPPRPATRLWKPPFRWAAHVYFYASRDTTGCGFVDDAADNHFPATPLIGLAWHLAGGTDLIRIGNQEVCLEMPRQSVSGRHDAPIVCRNRGDLHLFTIAMYPDAFAAIFGVLPGTLANRVIDAEKDLPEPGAMLFRVIAAAPNDEARIVAFEDFLDRHTGNFRGSLWTAVTRASSRISVALLARMLSLGHRQALRVLQHNMGFGVGELKKQARREIAYEHFAAKAQDRGAVSIADIAADSGYADQSHLSRECRSVTGRSFGQLLADIETREADWLYRAFMRPESR